MDFAVPADYRVKVKECQKSGQMLGHCQRDENVVNNEGDSDTNCNWCPCNGPQEPGNRSHWTGYYRNYQNHQDLEFFNFKNLFTFYHTLYKSNVTGL